MRLNCKEIDIVSVKKEDTFFSLRFSYPIDSIRNVIQEIVGQNVLIGYSHIKVENKLTDFALLKEINHILKNLLEFRSKLRITLKSWK